MRISRCKKSQTDFPKITKFGTMCFLISTGQCWLVVHYEGLVPEGEKSKLVSERTLDRSIFKI
jgi:hypothetical protein